MDELTLQSYREQVENLQQISRQNALGLIVNKLQYKSGYSNVVVAAGKNLTDYEILILCERFNELISIINVARHYVLEAVQINYNPKILDSIELTRHIHLYSANLWYNSIIDSIYLFYYLMGNADKITDDNYKKMLKKVRYEDDKKKVIIEIPTEKERKGFELLIKQLTEVNETANEIKHRGFNIYSNDSKQKNRSICVLRDFEFKFDGKKLNPSGDLSNRLSTKAIHPDFKDFTSFFNTLINADKNICDFLKVIIQTHFKIEK